jgi:hypothetical protein
VPIALEPMCEADGVLVEELLLQAATASTATAPRT